MDTRPSSLDHVALWVADRGPLTRFLCDHLGMHVIEETDSFTLVGIDAKLGKLTLFAAEGPRSAGALERVVLRVADLEEAAGRLPVEYERDAGVLHFDGPEGLRLGLVQADGEEYDLDHVVLRVPDPERAADELSALGFDRSDGRLEVAGRHLQLLPGEPADDGRPLLNHLALLVDSARAVQHEAEQLGMEIDDIKDAPNTFAVFVRGPAGIRVEYVEHKPGFALV